MVEVVGVHGIFQEQLGARQLLRSWAPALLDGLETAGGRAALPPDIAMAYYGQLFLTHDDGGKLLTKGTHDRGDPLDSIDGPAMDADEEAFLRAAVAELPEVSPVETKAGIPAPMRPLTRLLARRMDGRIMLDFVGALRQVRLYLDNDDLAAEARSAVERAVGDGCCVLVGHSLGSVIAFETLALRPDLQVNTLITLGSPLSMRTVASRLRAGVDETNWAMPGGVQRWVNIFDQADPVSAAGRVGRLWASAEDYSVANGSHPHEVTRYLGKRAVGEAILDAVPRLRPER